MKRRVVVTGMGVVSSVGNSVPEFLQAIRNGTSGIRFIPAYKEHKFNCQVSGNPDFELDMLRDYITETSLYGLKVKGIAYGIKASIDAWTMAGNPIESEKPSWDTGCIFGGSVADGQMIRNVINRVEANESRKLGSRIVEQFMNSGVTSYISGRLGLGNRVVSTSAACATGAQAILMGYEYIKFGTAKRMVVGSTEYVDSYMFGAFDSMRVLARSYNDSPERASRPMSATANGFVPGSGAGALILEDLDYALDRNAVIYAEILGGNTNSGGQRNGGTMTAPSSEGVIKCIQDAIADARVDADSIDLVSGHLTATMADKLEIKNWVTALGRSGAEFPLINSLKSMIGHCLSGAGSIEAVAAILQLVHDFAHPNINLEDPNPEIADLIGLENMPTAIVKKEINIVAKANFGFGDVNSCLILSKYRP
ncbi:beta-ketoacyl-[acyl-carrier-protein] synthase family protein [soil metagenome]